VHVSDPFRTASYRRHQRLVDVESGAVAVNDSAFEKNGSTFVSTRSPRRFV
jgi:hypothetical protein